MEFVDAAVLPGHGYPGPATTTDMTLVDTSAPRSTATQQTRQTDNLPTKLADTPTIDDEDLFLGDDNDNDEVDNREEADDVDDDEDDDDFDEDYFSSTYRPLSNLPTPPPSSHTSSLAQSPYAGGHNSTGATGVAADGSLLGPAVHLVNLLPPAASLATPSVALVQAMLARAQLPLDTVALAVCILDSLDSRFARAWRLTCPLAPPSPSSTESPSSLSSRASPAAPEKRHTLPSPLSPMFPTFAPPSDAAAAARGLHIDAVFPEVIVLAALVIAAKFTDDGFVSQQPAQAYCTAWGASGSSTSPGPCALWTGAQLAATERCIMQNLGYRILPLLDPDLLADAQADMRRAGAQALRSRRASTAPAKRAPAKGKTAAAIMTPPEETLVDGATSSAAAGLGLLQLTPSAVEVEESRDVVVVDTNKIISLNFPSNMQRRHVSSRSECLGRFSLYER